MASRSIPIASNRLVEERKKWKADEAKLKAELRKYQFESCQADQKKFEFEKTVRNLQRALKEEREKYETSERKTKDLARQLEEAEDREENLQVSLANIQQQLIKESESEEKLELTVQDLQSQLEQVVQDNCRFLAFLGELKVYCSFPEEIENEKISAEEGKNAKADLEGNREIMRQLESLLTLNRFGKTSSTPSQTESELLPVSKSVPSEPSEAVEETESSPPIIKDTYSITPSSSSSLTNQNSNPGKNVCRMRKRNTPFVKTSKLHGVNRGLSKFGCLCGNVYQNNNGLSIHIRRMTLEWKYKCNTCKLYFFYKYELRRHMLSSPHCLTPAIQKRGEQSRDLGTASASKSSQAKPTSYSMSIIGPSSGNSSVKNVKENSSP